MEIKKVPIEKVDLWKENPRNIKTKDFERLKKQIKEFGVYKPMVACPDGGGKYTILGGNMRLRALRELGVREVDISVVRPQAKAEKIKLALSDNDRAGYYEDEKLAELVYPHLQEIELEDFKIDVGEPVGLKEVVEDYGPNLDGSEDEVPEIDDSPAITQYGDLFQLGKHRLLCGDATQEEDVKRLMGGEKADMVLTDPPYGIDLETNYTIRNTNPSGYHGLGTKYGTRGKYPKVKGDNKQFNPNPLLKMFNYCKEIFLWGGDYYLKELPEGGSLYVWDKRTGIENIKFSASEFEICWSKAKHLREIIRVRWCGAHGTQNQDQKKRIHPTQKPFQVNEFFIRKFSKSDNLIIDVYMGSGSTLIACEQTNRTCCGMEIDPKYCDVIIKRYADFTGTPEEEIRKTVKHG